MKRLRQLISLFLICLLLISCETSGKKHPLAREGVLDLRDWDFEKDGVVKLEGEWEFYWQQLLLPENFSVSSLPKLTSYPYFPNFWKEHEHDSITFGNYGFATYRLKILLKESNKKLAIKLFEICTAYKLFIDDKQLIEVGTLGKTAEESNPNWKTQARAFQVEGNTLELTLQISNFDAGGGGVQRAIMMGQEGDISNLRRRSIGISLILCGIFLTFGFYHMLFYIQRPKEKTFLVIALSAACFFIYTICWHEAFFYELVPNLDWQVFARIAWVSVVLLPFFLSWFCKSILPSLFSDTVLKSILIFYSVLIMVIVVLPITVTFNMRRLIFLVLLAISIYCLYVAIVAIRKNKRGAYFVFFSIIAWLFGVICAGLYGIQVILVDLSHFGFLVLIMLQSAAVSFRFSSALNESETLNSELIVKNNRLLELDKLQQHALEKLHEADQIKDEFLANTSHELRTPLNGIIGLAEASLHALESGSMQKIHSNLSFVISSGRRLSLLVNDILDFSKLRHKEIPLNQQPVSLHRVIESVLALNRTFIGDKPIELINQVDKENTLLIIADEARLEQILYNLVSNAIKFTDQGTISISTRQIKEQIVISVSDTGIGISKDKQSKIFNAFEQIDGTETRKYEGTGLGLTIVKQLLELHQSQLTVESELEKGSVFSFSLPLASDADVDLGASLSRPETAELPEVHQLDHPLKLEQSKNKTPLIGLINILIVDDDPLNIEMVCQQLNSKHYELQVAHNGPQALKLVEQNKPDLILLDVMMPEMSGFEVCKRIRRKHHQNHLPIIFLTAKNREEDVIRGLEIGGNDYLTKPFFRTELIQRVETHLENMLYQKQSDTLKEFANGIGIYESHQEMMKNAFDQIALWSLVDEAALFQGDQLLYHHKKESAENESILKVPTKTILNKIKLNPLKPQSVTANHADENHPFGRFYKPGHFLVITPQTLPNHLFVMFRNLERKPFDESKPASYVQSMINQIQTTRNNLESLFEDNNLVSVIGKVQPRLHEITHVKSTSPTLELHFDSDKRSEYIDGCSLEKLSLYFKESLLMRIHKSYLVNASKVVSLQKTSKSRLLKIELTSGEAIPVGRTYMEKTRQVFNEM